ncbi:MAG: nitric oxide reductase transcriptional regulator NorR [Myxococcota bacterium]
MVVVGTTGPTDPLLSLALDLSGALATEDRYRRALEVVRQIVPCDSVCLLLLEGDRLVPVAAFGLSRDALGRTYPRTQARLAAIAASSGPMCFPPDSALEDPFDGMLEADPTALHRVHACLGCPLRVDGELVGVLAADALRPGAFDALDPTVLSWLSALTGATLRTARLIQSLEESARKKGLVAADLMRTVDLERGGGILGVSEPAQRLRKEIAVVAESDLTVLITGASGVGKELVARAVHAGSARKSAPLIYVNCAALPDSVAESELFGHVRGAFTGADTLRAGKFEVADGGTLFLDEVGELAPSVQPKLLRALQEGEIQRVGADRPLSVDVRVVAATNRDLRRDVESGRFRADLFHRLNVYPIQVPSLAERREDISILAGHFCDQARLRLGLGPVVLTREATALLQAGAWPGNVRELENVVFRGVIRAGAQVQRGEPVRVTPAELGLERTLRPSEEPPPAPETLAPGAPLREQVDEFQRQRIRQAVAECGGNWAAAARLLGTDRSNLHHLARRLGLSTDHKH